MAQDMNQHVKEYLRDFLARKDPGFAVLLSAPWGAGKTHLANQVLHDRAITEKHLYVSLFGCRNTDDIDRAILLARLPVQDSAATNAVFATGRGIAKFVKDLRFPRVPGVSFIRRLGSSCMSVPAA